MDRYQKVERPKTVLPINENEIRITTQGLVRNYISYASSLLQEKRGREIVFKAMGQAISKSVAVAEIIKRNNPHLHQDTSISSVSITDVFEPIEEGLQTVEQTRHVSMISITLSQKELNINSPGYQAPSQFEQTEDNQHQQPSRLGRPSYNTVNDDSYNRGRGRGGRGRGRGWARGGYGNYQENDGYLNRGGGGRHGRGRGHYENDGYSNRGGGGRRGGRGWGYHENDGYSNRGGGGRHGRGWGYNENDGYQNRFEDGWQGRGSGYNENEGYQNRGESGRHGRGRGYNENDGYPNRGRGGRHGGGRGGYNENGGYPNQGGGGRNGGGWGYNGGGGSGYERGRGGGRGYGRGRGRMGPRVPPKNEQED
ncbi:glycine-rich protein DOT1-like isoform X3 [Impatiens glandulifera]|uniref:glycine-rich protein DOT1-like isoform X3 n=1 Tax=Impatiens glandulifera TaxID=253017 RepID=UPI001FB0B722|nr:glycine-rich protein DOT1-like isoform X3 [Impatiens glandulifera]